MNTPTSPGDPTGPGAPASRSALPPGAADALVFLSAGAVLVLELSALRLLAPYLGLTLEMSTGVIGVALAAIAFGTWAGGRLADVGDPGRMLGPVLLASGVATWTVLPAVRGVGQVAGGQDGALVLLLAMLALFLPAALLSAVTPMVVKLQLRSLANTGAVVGRLSAVGTLGALVATFATGFVLFALVPTSRIVLATGTVLVVLGAGVLLRQRMSPRAAAATVVLALAVGGTAVATADPCRAETRYHCAAVVADPMRPGGRTLLLDRLRHSYVDVADPTHLEFDYARAVAAGIESAFPRNADLRVLHLGAGGMTLPRYLAATRPGSTGLVLEIDEGVVALVREEIAPDPAGVAVQIGDARVGLGQRAAGEFDVVIGDAFGALAVPWHLATREVAAEIGRVLAPGGLYALNVIDRPPLALLRAEVATIAAEFGSVALVSRRDVLSGSGGGNAVVLAAHDPLPLAELAERLGRDPRLAVLSGAELDAFVADASVLTDDLAPVDQLLTPYA